MEQAQRATQMMEKAQRMTIGEHAPMHSQHHMLTGGMMSLGDIEAQFPGPQGGKSHSMGQADQSFFDDGGGGGGSRGGGAATTVTYSPGQDLRKMLGVNGGAPLRPPMQPEGWEHELGVSVSAPLAGPSVFGGGAGGGGGGRNQGIAPRETRPGLDKNHNQQSGLGGGATPCLTFGKVNWVRLKLHFV